MQEISNPATGDFGSSSVGSRLAGDSPPVSSNGGGNSDTYQPFAAPKQSPIYQPSGVSQASSGGFTNGSGGGSSSRFGSASNMNVQAVTHAAMEKAEFIKSWSVKTFKCTKQILSERLGKGTKTVDVELEAKIEILRDTKRKYENLAAVSGALNTHISNMIQAQRVLSDAFSELSQKSNELKEEFQYNSDTQRVLVKNGETLLAAIQFFINGLNTLCKRTMEDTLLTVQKYEQARVEYDAYRTELETLTLAPRTASTVTKQGAAEVNFNKQKEIYERLRKDVGVKLQFLDENRVKVMQKHLLLFHNAITAFFAGNQQMLEATIKQFSVNPKAPGQSSTSFLEKD